MRYTDRSRIVKDWTCPRARYLGYELYGQGIAPDVTSLELGLGIAVHDALAEIARQQQAEDGDPVDNPNVDIDAIATAAQQQVYDSLTATEPGEVPSDDARTFASEQACMVEGMLRGFHRHVWPQMMSRYTRIVAVEQEMTLPLAEGITFMSKPDLVVEDADGEWWYVEYKTTSSKKSQWIDSWNTAVQVHSGIRAVEHTLGHPVTGVVVQGLYKGYESYGRQNSPFCYAYVRSGRPPFTQDEVRYDYASGFRRQPVWERPGGVKQWVEEMPAEILADQFPATPPIFVKEELVDAFLQQTAAREDLIASAMRAITDVNASELLGDVAQQERIQLILDDDFPQHFEACQPAWGRGCSFKRLCHGRVDDPLRQGFTVREPHHTPEADAWAAEGGDA
jgi:hypothetical protein